MSTRLEQLSPDEARRFEHFSIHNAVQAEGVCPTLECRAYADIFTFRRWHAQGYKVKKGEQGALISTWVPVAELDDREERVVRRRRPKTAVVFCRHQVEPRRSPTRPKTPPR